MKLVVLLVSIIDLFLATGNILFVYKILNGRSGPCAFSLWISLAFLASNATGLIACSFGTLGSREWARKGRIGLGIAMLIWVGINWSSQPITSFLPLYNLLVVMSYAFLKITHNKIEVDSRKKPL